ncbi:unnamed protein product, partial [Meganyctiphanes norvegica]
DKSISEEKENVQHTEDIDTLAPMPTKRRKGFPWYWKGEPFVNNTQKVYDLRMIEDSNHKDIKKDINPEWMAEHPMMLMVKHNRIKLLQHPLTNNWLKYTWWHFTWIIFAFLLSLHIVDAVLLTLYMDNSWSWVQFDKNDSETLIRKKCNGTSPHLNIFGCPKVNKVVYGFLWISVFLCASTEVLGMYKLRHKYLESSFVMNLVNIILTVILLSPFPSFGMDYAILKDFQFISGIFAVLLAWLLLMTTLNRYYSKIFDSTESKIFNHT